MADLKWDVPAAEEITLDDETLTGIDRGIEDVENGRHVSVEEARKLIPKWLSKFASPKPR